MVRKADLKNCQFLKIGVNVEFECHVDKRGLIARNVKLLKQQNAGRNQNNHNRNNVKDNHGNSANHDGYGYSKPHPFGVMS